MKKIIIAIDGYSSTGKSTVAKQLARALGYVYVDTGAMYRAVTLFAMRNQFIGEDFFQKEKLIESLADVQLNFHFNAEKGFAEMYLNGENVEQEIRTMEVSNFVSQVATIPEVRKKQVQQQHELGKEKGIVMDGRDIGTVVFPNAELKLFMTASAQTRAQRRFEELQQKGENVTFDEVLQNVKSRDQIDTSRKDSPLIKAKDAVVIDNSEMSLDEQFEKILSLAKNSIEKA
ncbi:MULTISPECIES: (d)CMP kinase [Mesonia]|uniref:Cytidylate kinase n=1 Tax=Mesonia oceanica TaxID=2687242 RepID=A0AC61Y9K6_9FLAO|nr:MULTISPECIES: (d)CMP kinase [Mesonia]MAN26322.1 cytidylate kinase [Mesonia sp.]MAQ42264.1 cytidylate kinase [Mesonia sp.]MBJ98550.1 cytidylate kinase [Flavobacteriaceae bacterium]VVV00035.1 Cytidylate kinase [Mesonia oceanica]|tara:strand:+ start:7916 stop:8608 length:693 start_codon:yes stop_codon:yes gene_type:complete